MLDKLKWRLGLWFEQNRFSIGVFGAVFNSEGKLVIVRQKGRKKWTLPGGGVGKKDLAPAQEWFGNDYEAALLHALYRELKEEIQLDGAYILDANPVRNFLSARLKDLAVVYRVETREGATFSRGGEIAEVRLVAKEDLDRFSMLGPRMNQMVKWAFENKNALG